MTRLRPAFLAGLAALLLLAGCGGDESESDLSPLATAGREVALSEGCVACHGNRGEGGVGPPWIGLAGSTVELEDGRAVTADAAYLRRAIVDPQADIVAGMTVRMPVNELTDGEVDALIAYIQELQ